MAGAASILFTGCSDWLDPKPLSFFTPENTYNSYDGLKTGTDMLNRDVRYFDYYPTSFSADPCILSEYFFSEMAVNGRTDAGNTPVDLTALITPSANLKVITVRLTTTGLTCIKVSKMPIHCLHALKPQNLKMKTNVRKLKHWLISTVHSVITAWYINTVTFLLS